MTIHVVTSLEERLERARRFDQVYGLKPYSLSLRQFLAHVDGLGQLAGKKILEIGGTDKQNMADYFLGIGIMYHCVRLEENPSDYPWVHPVRDFRDLPSAEPYDLIISCGVFEIAGMDRKIGSDRWGINYTNHAHDLQQLFALTNSGGVNIIGTISHPCIYTNEEIVAAGFRLRHREKPFYSLMTEGYAVPPGRSELVILEK